MSYKIINQKNFGCLNKGRATVLFFHPTCIHCIMMRKEWEKMKESLKRRKRNCNIYEINGEELQTINTPLKGNVDGFPTIMNIENGTMKESFMGDRTMEKLIEFAEKNENTSLPIVIKRRKENPEKVREKLEKENNVEEKNTIKHQEKKNPFPQITFEIKLINKLCNGIMIITYII